VAGPLATQGAGCLGKASGDFDGAQEVFGRWLRDQGMVVDDLGTADLTFRRAV
jgi:hypothetical protein